MTEEQDPTFKALLDYIYRQRGIDFSLYKPATLRRRIGKRMQKVGAEGFAAYLDHLQVAPQEFGELLDTLFINVTGFFRDVEAWQLLEREVLPALLDGPQPPSLRIWCAGVASGEEAYTVAMLLAERMEPDELADTVKIFATDIDEGALAQARPAIYPAESLADVPETLRARYFTPVGDRFQLLPELRRSVIFGRHDLLEDAPISRLDLLVCRNTLMYFNREAQNRILARFHFALEPDGILFLGNSEMLLTRRSLFAPLDPRVRMFRKVSPVGLRERLSVFSPTDGEDEDHALFTEVQLQQLAFDHSAVAEIVIDASGLLALANPRARALLRLAPDDLGRPFQDLELSYRPAELRGPLEAARASGRPVEVGDVEWRGDDGESIQLHLRVLPLTHQGGVVAVKVDFVDVTHAHRLAAALARSTAELETAYEELQSANEELETTNEELQSTVEELETTNEELQSTNEELETMNEELQATNVEIETVNHELRERTEELTAVSHYAGAILNSMRAAVVVLDPDLKVRTWSDRAGDLWGLRADEVTGRHLPSLDIGLPVAELRDGITACMRGERAEEHLTLAGHDRRGKPIEHEVTCTPLRDPQGRISGAILVVDGRNRA